MNWNIGKLDHRTIMEIADRAYVIARENGIAYDKCEIMMDITATHLNGCPLQLSELASAPQFDFVHDVFGIRRHIDRKTGALKDCFLPRYAAQVQP